MEMTSGSGKNYKYKLCPIAHHSGSPESSHRSLTGRSRLILRCWREALEPLGGEKGGGGTPTKAPADWSANPAGSSRPAGAEQTQSPCNGCGKQEILVKAQEEETQQALNCGPISVFNWETEEKCQKKNQPKAERKRIGKGSCRLIGWTVKCQGICRQRIVKENCIELSGGCHQAFSTFGAIFDKLQWKNRKAKSVLTIGILLRIMWNCHLRLIFMLELLNITKNLLVDTNLTQCQWVSYQRVVVKLFESF